MLLWHERRCIIAGPLGYPGGYTGGAERQLHYMVRALAEARVDVRVYTLDGESALPGLFGALGVAP